MASYRTIARARRADATRGSWSWTVALPVIALLALGLAFTAWSTADPGSSQGGAVAQRADRHSAEAGAAMVRPGDLDSEVDRWRRRLSEGMDPNTRLDEEEGLSPLAVATWNADLPAMRLLLMSGADPSLASGPDGSTPLHIAALVRCPEAASVLLRHGASVDRRDSSGCTPLMAAALWGDPGVPSVLLATGADPNCVLVGGGGRQDGGVSALDLARRAADRGHGDITLLLLACGALPFEDISGVDGGAGPSTPPG